MGGRTTYCPDRTATPVQPARRTLTTEHNSAGCPRTYRAAGGLTSRLVGSLRELSDVWDAASRKPAARKDGSSPVASEVV